MKDWLYQKIPLIDPPESVFGFIYMITNNITGRKYIGKKQFISKRSKKVKGKKNRTHFIKPSDWQSYWGSCEELIEDIKILGEENFTREIIRLCNTKRDLTFGEIELQIKNDVLTSLLPNGEREYYNKNIMSRWFIPTPMTDDHREKIRKAQKGIKRKPLSKEHKQKISESLKGNTFSLGYKQTPEHKNKHSQSSKGQKKPPRTIEHTVHLNESLGEKYQIIFPDGTIKEIKNLLKFSKENNLSSSCMYLVSKGKQKQHKGFKCIKLDKPVKA